MLRLLLVAVLAGLTSAQQPCGFKRKPLPDFNIVGGDDAAPNSWPWQLSFQYGSGFHFCGASLISTEWIVSAAHCVDGASPSSLYLLAGEHAVFDDSDDGTEQERQVDFYVMHPLYNFPQYDVALVHVSDPFDITDEVIPACLPSPDYDYTDDNTDDTQCWISGWGALSGSGSSPDILQEVRVDVMGTPATTECGYDSVQCVQGYDNPGSVGGCFGDSGGPISCMRDGNWDVIGAASFVYGSCNTGLPTGYANLQYLFWGTTPWVTEVTGIQPRP